MPSCFVRGCKNSTRNRSDVSYHSFPKDVNIREQWLKLIGRDPNYMVIYERVCSEHFSKDDILLSGNKKFLKPNSMPVNYLPVISPAIESVKKEIKLLSHVNQNTSSLSAVCDVPVASSSGVKQDRSKGIERHYLDSPSLPDNPTSASSFVKVKLVKTNFSLFPERDVNQKVRGDTSSLSAAVASSSSVQLDRSKGVKNHSLCSPLLSDSPASIPPFVKIKLVKRSENFSSNEKHDDKKIFIHAKEEIPKYLNKVPSRLYPEYDENEISIHAKKVPSSLYLEDDDEEISIHAEKEIPKHAKRGPVLKTKLDTYKKTRVHSKRKISSLKEVIVEIRRKFQISANAIEILEATFSDVPSELMKRILENNRVVGREKNFEEGYPVELKEFAMNLQFYCPQAYQYVRKTFNLAVPPPSIIRSWLLKSDYFPGFTKQALELLRTRACEYRIKTGHQLLGCLLMNEMALEKGIVLDEESRSLWGYNDVGIGNEPDVATDAFVFMVVGVNDCFKIPIAYFLIRNFTSEERANLVQEALKQLDSVDLRILSVTCNDSNVNFKVMTELGSIIDRIGNLKTYFLHPTNSEKVYITLDICHMLTLMRINWASAKIFIDINGNEIRWEFIDMLQRILQEEDLYFPEKLRDKYIKWKKFIIKINVAAQTLSSSVADTLEFLCKDMKLEDFRDVMPTVYFLRRIYNLYDLLNSRNPFATEMNTPLRKKNEFYWRPFLIESKNYLKNLKLANGGFLHTSTLKSPCIGFLVAIDTFINIYDEEVKMKKSLKYVSTYKFSQDHLELFFCCVRSRNGPYQNPNCLQFFHTYRKLLSHIDVKNNTGNCLYQDSRNSFESLECNKQITDISLERRRQMEVANLENNFQLFLPSDFKDLEENAVTYIAGFMIDSIIQNISCISCAEALSEDLDNYDNPLKLTHKQIDEGLLYPSTTVRLLCKKTERLIKVIYNILGYLPKQDIIMPYLRRKHGEFFENVNIFPTLHDHMLDQAPYEIVHRQSLIKLVIEKYASIRLNRSAHKRNVFDSAEKVRKILNELVLFKYR